MRKVLDLREITKIVHAKVPSAVRIVLQTSDQDTYGFRLEDVIWGAGQGTPVGYNIVEDLNDDLDEYLSDLRWDASVGEDKGGRADLILWHVASPRTAVNSSCLFCGLTVTLHNARWMHQVRQQGDYEDTEIHATAAELVRTLQQTYDEADAKLPHVVVLYDPEVDKWSAVGPYENLELAEAQAAASHNELNAPDKNDGPQIVIRTAVLTVVRGD